IWRERCQTRSCQTSFPREPDDSVDDLLQRESRGVDLHRVVRRAQGAVLAALVALVALALRGQDSRLVLAGLGGAAEGTLLSGGGEEDLERRLGAVDGADSA